MFFSTIFPTPLFKESFLSTITLKNVNFVLPRRNWRAFSCFLRIFIRGSFGLYSFVLLRENGLRGWIGGYGVGGHCSIVAKDYLDIACSTCKRLISMVSCKSLFSWIIINIWNIILSLSRIFLEILLWLKK